MTYLAVRLSQWGAGDYWEDVDQYVRNHLADIQPRDTRSGYPLYSTRSVESLCRPAATKTVRRFVPAQP